MVFSETQTRRWFSGLKCFEWTWPEKKSVLNEHEIVFEWKKKVHNKINFKFVLVVEEVYKSKCSCVNFLSIFLSLFVGTTWMTVLEQKCLWDSSQRPLPVHVYT